MKIAYGDLIGGISGDMFVAALIDLGLPLAKLKAELKKIPTLEFALKTAKKSVHAVRASQFQVICPRHEAPRSWQQIRRLLERSKLAASVKATAIDIFNRLAQAEAKIHGVAVDQVHFHEVGATDSIVDIVAAAIGVGELAIDQLHFSPIPLGRGVTRSQHGPLPVPGPATMELLKGLPTFGIDLDSETVTPTGAALLKVFGSSFGDQPAMTIDRIGYGTGQKEFSSRPNLLRLSIGANAVNLQHEAMLVIETNIDDMNPQHFDHVMERLLAAGARDVCLAPIQMKKNRPATLLTVICEIAQRDRLAAMILQETTTIGVRCYPVSRILLAREAKTVKTRFGEVTVKIVTQPDGTERATPEYDDLKRIASAKRTTLKTVHDEVMRQLK
ncbi:MAG TPA: nickel pincer cofactor biosynthesis protein LarC [Candidatus Limnocylindria bacterium]|nr:nickel pincer cofactor biosynthesis protein LarC [Candidatus Limnocylindria bacterium]